MDKKILENYISLGYNGSKISKVTGKSDTTVRYWLKKFNLSALQKRKNQCIWNNLPWSDIQKSYDNNGTYRSIRKEFKCLNPQCLVWAKKNGFLKFRSHKEAMKLSSKLGRPKGATIWTTARRLAASKRMSDRIEKDPTNHPNRKLANNRNKMSFPEKVAYNYLLSNGIKFEHNKYIKPYWVDFCIEKIIIEIDGKRWHIPEKDAIRDQDLLQLGYIVYRFDAQKIVRNVSILDDVIKNFIAQSSKI
jgi:very-short-patch-repair endonuclease